MDIPVFFIADGLEREMQNGVVCGESLFDQTISLIEGFSAANTTYPDIPVSRLDIKPTAFLRQDNVADSSREDHNSYPAREQVFQDSKPEFDLPVCSVITQEERAQVGDIGRKSAIGEAEASLRTYLEGSLRTRLNASPCKPTA